MRVLVTRPKEDSARTAALLAARCHMAVLAPLFEVRALPCQFPDRIDAVMATSANALRFAPAEELRRLLDLPILTVGDATAAEARALGFIHVTSACGDSADLARLAAVSLAPGATVLQLAAPHRRDVPLAALDGFLTRVVLETYDTVAVSALPEAAAQGLASGELDAVLHFSPRAATVFADLAQRAGMLEAARRTIHVYISAAARDARLPAGRIATNPSLESVVNAL